MVLVVEVITGLVVKAITGLVVEAITGLTVEKEVSLETTTHQPLILKVNRRRRPG